MRGRTFTMEDEAAHSPIAVLSYAWWTRQFGRGPSVIGQPLYVKDVPFTIVGVAPPGFIGLEQEPTDLWVPFQDRPELRLCGTLACTVSRRTSEVGVRVALGAQRRQVLWMILRGSLWVTAAGVAVGLPLAIAATKALQSMLFGVKPRDPTTFAAALAGIAVVSLVASMIPALRAASVDPMVALRDE
jgi:hypothetical protein